MTRGSQVAAMAALSAGRNRRVRPTARSSTRREAANELAHTRIRDVSRELVEMGVTVGTQCARATIGIALGSPKDGFGAKAATALTVSLDLTAPNFASERAMMTRLALRHGPPLRGMAI